MGWNSSGYINVYEDATIQAQYQRIYYTVTFNANGGNFVPGLITSQEVAHGENAYNLAILPYQNGHSFTGWYTDEQATQSFTFSEETGESIQPITEDITLYAGWEEIDEVDDGDGGDDGDDDDDDEGEHPGFGDGDCSWEVELPFNYFRETLRFNSYLRRATPPEGMSDSTYRECMIRAFHRAVNIEYIKDIERSFTPSDDTTQYGDAGLLTLLNMYHQFEKSFLHLSRIVDLGDDTTYQDTRNILLGLREDVIDAYQTYIVYTERDNATIAGDGHVVFEREPTNRFTNNYQRRLLQYVELADTEEFRQEPPVSPFRR